jgi:hypothetical protein
MTDKDATIAKLREENEALRLDAARHRSIVMRLRGLGGYTICITAHHDFSGDWHHLVGREADEAIDAALAASSTERAGHNTKGGSGMKYRKKPVVIEAMSFDGAPASAVAIFEVFDIPGGKFLPDHDLRTGKLLIPTMEGDMTASRGDWIIKGIAGEFYPCKPDIFANSYEPQP